MKNVKRNIFRATLFLLTVVLLSAWVSTAVIAGGDPTCALTLNVDSDTVASCLLTVKDRNTGEILTLDGQKYDQLPMTGGQTYHLPIGVKVTVTVTPKACYSPALKDQVGAGSLQISTMHWDNFLEDFSATVTGIPRTYNVVVLDYDKVGFYGDGLEGLNYEIEDSDVANGWTMSDFEKGKLKYTFLDTESLTELPAVKKPGYVFKGWNVMIGADSTIPADYNKDDGKYHISPNTQSTYFDTSGEVYVYPVMEPIKYPVYRYDYVYDSGAQHDKFHGERLSNAIPGEAVMDTRIDGLLKMDDDLGGYKQYPGYLLMNETQYNYQKYASAIVNKPWGEGVSNTNNIVYRMYQAIVYELVFLDDNGLPLAGYSGKTYSYATRTEILDPTRTGYTFRGWTVEVYKDGKWETHEVAPGFVFAAGSAFFDPETGARKDPNAIFASELNPDGKYEIRLTANWTPNDYNVKYDWNVGGDVELEGILHQMNPSLPAQFTFDSVNGEGEKKLSIPNPVRNGYDFIGWTLWRLDADGNPITDSQTNVGSDFALDTSVYACNVRLVANWRAHKYLVTLNGGEGALDGYTPSIDGVEFDKALELESPIVCPQKTGFTFLGYFDQPEGGKQYINAEGESVCSKWNLYGESDGASIPLYAQWSRNSYTVAVDANDLPEGTVILIVTSDGTRYPYEGTPVSLLYETSFVVAITTPEGYKLVKWNGDAVAHSDSYTSASLFMGAQDMTVTATILPVVSVPSITPNYLAEKAVLNFGADGKYILSVRDLEDLVVTIQNGVIRVNGQRVDAVVIPEEYFGKTVSVTYKGDEETGADSDPVEVSIVARPEPPRPEVELDRIDDTDDRKLTVYMYDGLFYSYEFAISRTNDPAGIKQWFSDGTAVYAFTDLQPGTAYYVFIRAKATEDAPHGQIYVTRNPYYTPTKDYVDATIDELNGLVQGSKGDITSALIQGAVDQINQWASQQPLPDTFYDDVEELMNKIKNEQLTFAQSQDAKIAALEAFLKECLASGSFTEEHVQNLKDLCANAVTGITAGKSEEEIQRLFETTMVSMEMIPVTYRYDVNHIIQLISKLGLPQDSKLTLTRLNDIATLKQAVQEAIRSGGVVTGDVELLKTLEVVAAYKFKLDTSAVNMGDKFTVRLTVPADLQSYTGLQIAYYAETANGITVEYVPSTVEGNEIVFETNRVGDFVIFADSTVDLTAIIAVLGAILSLQIIALAAVLITRQNAKKRIVANRYSIAFPAFLAVHFLPVGGEVLALLMGAAVILLQVILMILLLKSDMVHLSKKDKTAPVAEEEKSETAPVDNGEELDLPAEEQEFSEDSEEERIAAFLYGSDATEPVDEESDPAVDDPFAMYGQAEDSEEEAYAESDAFDEESEDVMDVFGEDFIEPAPDPYYSLPDEDADAPYAEEAYAEEEYADEESDAGEYTEEAYSEEYADEEAYEDAESFSLDDAFAEEGYAEETYAEEAYAEEAEADLASEEFAEEEAYVSDYVEEEPYDESSFEDAYVAEFYGESEAVEEIPAEETPTEEELYAEEPVFEAPVYEADEAEEDTDPMYRYDE